MLSIRKTSDILSSVAGLYREMFSSALELLPDHEPKVYKDYRRLLDDKGVDTVSIITPPHLHREMT